MTKVDLVRTLTKALKEPEGPNLQKAEIVRLAEVHGLVGRTLDLKA